jgi:hypothetical protein
MIVSQRAFNDDLWPMRLDDGRKTYLNVTEAAHVTVRRDRLGGERILRACNVTRTG